MNDDPLHPDTPPAVQYVAGPYTYSQAEVDAFFARLNERRPPIASLDPDFDVDIDHVIASLNERHASLSQHIDRHWDDLDANHLARLLALYGQNATRIGRLLRDRCAILGQPDDPKDIVMKEALTIAHVVLGMDPLDLDALSDLDVPHNQIPIDFDHLIADLDAKQTRLAQHIESQQHDWDAAHLSRLFTVYGRNAARLGRLLRQRHAMYGAGLDRLNAISAKSDFDVQEWADSLPDEPE